MGKIIVNLKIILAKPEYTDQDYEDIEAWLQAHMLSGLPQDAHSVYEWHNTTTIEVNVTIEWVKDQFLKADFAAMRAWLDTHVYFTLPTNAHAYHLWKVLS